MQEARPGAMVTAGHLLAASGLSTARASRSRRPGPCASPQIWVPTKRRRCELSGLLSTRDLSAMVFVARPLPARRRAPDERPLECAHTPWSRAEIALRVQAGQKGAPQEGVLALEDRSCRPHSSPTASRPRSSWRSNAGGGLRRTGAEIRTPGSSSPHSALYAPDKRQRGADHPNAAAGVGLWSAVQQNAGHSALNRQPPIRRVVGSDDLSEFLVGPSRIPRCSFTGHLARRRCPAGRLHSRPP
jgi:hypothetical protein